jgi:2-dehydro-3-deoxyphosphogluconate aldolase / (4S)-4-hydroxy-2-oxoglutarate aldolase
VVTIPPMHIENIATISPVVPVVVFKDMAHAVPTARALLAGGIRIIEVTLRTDVSLACLEAIAREVPEMITGAGTVRKAEEVARVKNAGAKFIVTPGFCAAVSEQCTAQGVPLLPGVSTATELMAAHDAGHSYLKLFPAEAVGGIKLLKALHGPFPDVRFCPTGGITAQSASDYLALPNVVCVGGSWLVTDAALQANDYSAITTLACEACALRA